MGREADLPAVGRCPRGLLFLASGFGAGLLPRGKGTAGTLVAALMHVGLVCAHAPWWWIPVLAVFWSIVSLACGGAAERYLGKDPPSFVLDEFAGYMVAATCLPEAPMWAQVGGAFVLFRALDIWKPFGIKRLQDLPGTWGILVDDLAAGVVANLLLQVGLRIAV